MKVFSSVALIASVSAVRLDVVPVDRINWPGAILPADRAHEKAPGSTFVDKDFDPLFDRYRYGIDGKTYVNGSSLAQASDAPIDANYDPMYNRFRYGDTFVKGSSVA